MVFVIWSIFALLRQFTSETEILPKNELVIYVVWYLEFDLYLPSCNCQYLRLWVWELHTELYFYRVWELHTVGMPIAFCNFPKGLTIHRALWFSDFKKAKNNAHASLYIIVRLILLKPYCDSGGKYADMYMTWGQCFWEKSRRRPMKNFSNVSLVKSYE